MIGSRFEVETPRLWLLPLSSEELRLRARAPDALAVRLGLSPTGPFVYGDARYHDAALKAMERAADLMDLEPSTWLWRTFWQLVLKEEGRIVGEFDFHGPPDQQGRVSFGYMTQPAYRGRGYMTEAARALTGWALAQDGAWLLEAETERDNHASHRVLEKLGATIVAQSEAWLRWRLAAAGPHPPATGER